MRTYLANLHKQSHDHKKRFAFLVSAGLTLLIFGIWVLVNFGVNDKNIAEAEKGIEANPLSSLIGGVGATFKVIWSDFGDIKQGLEVVEFEAQK